MNLNYFDVVFLEQEASIKYPDSFAIITAHNPKDIILSKSENQSRNHSLVQSIKETMKLGPCIVGMSKDEKHQELSVIIEGTRNELIALGRKFEQHAIFWVKGDNLDLQDCVSMKRYDLGSFRERIKK